MEPVSRMTREAVIERLCELIAAPRLPHPTRVAVDGPDAAGKTTLADALASELRGRDREVIRASIDGFHRARADRYRLGTEAPRGYYDDSFDYGAFREVLLDPLGAGGDLRYRRAVFDFRSDGTVSRPIEMASPDAVLVVDGVFLFRPELVASWDVRIFVSAEPEVTLRRALQRDAELFGSRSEVERRYRGRYIPAQRLYGAECRPAETADVVVLNDDPGFPVLREAAIRS
jgi:uridine kinase